MKKTEYESWLAGAKPFASLRMTTCWLAAAMLSGVAADAHAGIFNATYTRDDGYFLPNYVSGAAPRVTIMRGFCYDFDLNGDFIDLTEKVSSTSSGIGGLKKSGSKNGAQNSVNGRSIGQITVHFCVDPNATDGDKTIKVLNFGGGEFDRLVVSVSKGGKWTGFNESSNPVRVNIPFQFTVNGSDLRDASIEGNGIRRVADASDVNTDAQLRMTLIFDASVGSQTSNQVLFLRRFSGGTGSAITDPGMVRNGSATAGMIMAVTGSSPITGTPVLPHQLLSGPQPQPIPATIQDLVLHAISGKSLRHVANFRKIDEAFCTGFAVPPLGGATEHDITVPGWGLSVSNSTSGAYSNGGTLELSGYQPGHAPIQIGTLSSGASVSMPFTRPTSVSRAILILPTTLAITKQLYGGASAIGCYQAVLPANDPRDWVDPPFSLILRDVSGSQVHSVHF